MNNKGAVIVEFSIIALIFISIVVSTVEMGIELLVYQSVERTADDAWIIFSKEQSLAKTDDELRKRMPIIVRSCMEPVQVRVFDSILSKDVTKNSGGDIFHDGDDLTGKKFAKIDITCKWQRITPFIRILLGKELNYTITTYSRI